MKLFGDFFMEYIKNIGARIYRRGGPYCSQGNRARPPLGRALMPCGAHRRPSDLIPTLQILFPWEKNKRRSFIMFYDTESPPPPVLHREGCSGVRSGLRRGGFVAIIITNPSSLTPSWCSPPGVSKSFVGLLDSDGIGWDWSCNRVKFDRAWSLVSTMFWDWCCYDFAMLNACH